MKKTLENNETKKIFTKDHLAYEHLDNFKNNDLLNTIKFIAEEGKNGFYQGLIADNIVSTLNDLGGLHTSEDFQNMSQFGKILLNSIIMVLQFMRPHQMVRNCSFFYFRIIKTI